MKTLIARFLKRHIKNIKEYVWYYKTIAFIKKDPMFLKSNGLRKKKRVFIVGNGPSLLNRDLGKFIDNSDVVIRINYFQINGFEKDVGAKVTHWAVGLCGSLFTGISASLQYYKEIIGKAERVVILNEERCKKETGEGASFFSNLCGIQKEKLDFFPMELEHLSKRILQYLPSTGFMCLLYAIRNWPDFDIYIAGMASKNALKKGHYFDKDHYHWVGHNFARESNLIHFLDKRGLIHILDS